MIYIEQFIRGIKNVGGLKTALAAYFANTLTVAGGLVNSGTVTGMRQNAAVVTGDTTLTTADSGKTFIDTKGSATTTFTLPDAGTTKGLEMSFVNGDASGEILITPASGDKIVGKTHGAENGSGIAPAAGTGIKNTAATNVKGDFCTLVFDGVDTWWMTAVAGVWASQ